METEPGSGKHSGAGTVTNKRQNQYGPNMMENTGEINLESPIKAGR